MKKSLAALFVVLLATAMLVSNVMAAPVQAGKNVTLMSTIYQRGGIVLSFHTTGLSKNDLKDISLTAHSKQWNISCNFVDDTTDVRCVVTKTLSRFHGEEFHGSLTGFVFKGIVPEARTFALHVTSTPTVTNTPTTTETTVTTSVSSTTEASVVNNPPLISETPNECPDGQILVYDFEWSGVAQSDGFVATSTVDPTHIGEPYDYYTTYTSEGTVYYSYYIHITYTFTSSGSIAPAQWDSYVDNMKDQGYTVEKTGEHCE